MQPISETIVTRLITQPPAGEACHNHNHGLPGKLNEVHVYEGVDGVVWVFIMGLGKRGIARALQP
jgi:hypothetical protein